MKPRHLLPLAAMLSLSAAGRAEGIALGNPIGYGTGHSLGWTLCGLLALLMCFSRRSFVALAFAGVAAITVTLCVFSSSYQHGLAFLDSFPWVFFIAQCLGLAMLWVRSLRRVASQSRDQSSK